ncbi:MAG: WD40 repeat domain-containing protein, partial [Planctomycetota bacterium]
RVAGLALTDIRTLDATPLHFACSTGAGRAVIFDRTEGWAEALFEVPTGRSARLALFGQEGRAAYSVMRRRLRVLGPEPGRVRRVAGGDATQIRVLDGAWEAPYFAAHSTETHYTVRYLDQDEDLVPRGDRAIRDSGTTQLAISPDGLSLIAQFRYGKAQIWEKSRGPSMARVAAYLSAPTTIVWPKGGEAVLVGGSSGEWRLIPRPGFDVGIPGVSEVRGHFSDVTSFSFDSDGKHFAVAEESGVWSVWSVDRHLPQATNVQGIKPTQHIAISSTEGRPHRVAVAGEGVGVWTLNPDQLLDQALYTGIMSPLACCGIAWRFPDDSALEPELLSAGTNGRIYRSWLPAGKDVWESKVLCSIDATLTAFDHHQGAGVTVVGSDDGRIWRITQDRRSGALRPELMADMGRRITSVGIGTLAEAVSFFTGDEHLHLIDMNRSTPELRWSVEASAAGSQEILSTAIAVDEASGWIVTAGADGAMQLWSLIDGMSGPLLEMRFGYFRGVEFPRPNSAPISVEARGRVTFIETEGANRMLELAAIEPTQAERLNVMFLAPRVRLAEIGKALDAGLAGRVELESMRKTVEGLQYVARFYEENVPSEMADAMLERVEAALQSLDDAN